MLELDTPTVYNLNIYIKSVILLSPPIGSRSGGDSWHVSRLADVMLSEHTSNFLFNALKMYIVLYLGPALKKVLCQKKVVWLSCVKLNCFVVCFRRNRTR